MAKQFVALARVSSREQEREGFSLEIQEDALHRYALDHGGTIVQFYKIAETASKAHERRTFNQLLSYAKKNATKLDGLLFYKLDRAARNLPDYVKLEQLESDYGLKVIYVTQPTENTPAGRMQRRMLASMASFYTEQSSIDVKEGLQRRVQAGLFVGMAPYGYRNVRKDGRGLVEIDPENAPKVRKIFNLYAYHGHTLDSLVETLERECIPYTAKNNRFTRSKLHTMLRDRSYIGDVAYHDQWYPGTQEPLVDRGTFERVQVLLGNQTYQSHEMVYASELITCSHCGHPITGEVKKKKTKSGIKVYKYYRCGKYTREGHPRTRLREQQLDDQVLAQFELLRVQDEKVRDWFANALRARTRHVQQDTAERVADLHRQISSLSRQEDELLNLRLHKEIGQDTFAAKSTELRDRIARLTLQAEACRRNKSEHGDIAVKAFELSQVLTTKWLTADVRAKRQILQILCLNFSLEGEKLVFHWRKPFDMLAKGAISEKSRGDRI